MTLTTFTLLLIYLAAFVIISVIYHILLGRARRRIREAREEANDYFTALNDLKDTFTRHAYDEPVTISHDRAFHIFEIRRDGLVIKRIPYDPDDPDDFDYKRIHTEEIAEKLNEKP